MYSDHGTGGIAHTIHVAKETEDGLDDFQKYENVLDVMNLPNGAVKFYYEGGEKLITGGRIVRSTVKGVKDAFRYRCSECEEVTSDVISQQDRGDSITMNCTNCGSVTDHEKREMDDL